MGKLADVLEREQNKAAVAARKRAEEERAHREGLRRAEREQFRADLRGVFGIEVEDGELTESGQYGRPGYVSDGLELGYVAGRGTYNGHVYPRVEVVARCPRGHRVYEYSPRHGVGDHPTIGAASDLPAALESGAKARAKGCEQCGTADLRALAAAGLGTLDYPALLRAARALVAKLYEGDVRKLIDGGVIPTHPDA